MEFRETDNRILYTDGTRVLAEITFSESSPDVLCIDHTAVDDSLKGQGIAGQLVQRAVDAIHARGCRVTATCSYAAHWLEKHPQD